MKAQTYHVKAGWRPWSFLYLELSSGEYGWSEFTASNSLRKALDVAIHELADLCQISAAIEIPHIIETLRKQCRQSQGALTTKALSAIENALWDMKARSLNTTVGFLLGSSSNPLPIYWSHFGTSRIRAADHVQCQKIKQISDLEEICNEALKTGVRCVKTNLFMGGEFDHIYMPGFSRCNTRSAGLVLGHKEKMLLKQWFDGLDFFLDESIEIAVDFNYNLSLGDLSSVDDLLPANRIAWVEIDSDEPEYLKHARSRIRHRISTGENISSAPHFMRVISGCLTDYIGVDMQWIGLSQARAISSFANQYEIMISPHNFNGHLSSFMAATFAASVPNLGYLEFDFDDVPWRDELFTNTPLIGNGTMDIRHADLGWGTEPIMAKLVKFRYED